MPNKLSYIFGILLITASCRQTPEGYVRFINDAANGLSVQRSIDDVHYKAQLLPADYQILLARGGDAVISRGARDSLRTLYNAYYYVRFEVGAAIAPSVPEAALQYDAAKDFILLHGKDSLAAVICQPVAGGKRYTYEYILAFPRTAGSSVPLELVYYNPAWKKPVQQFRFKYENSDVTLF